jgi:hypothetical protein
MTAPFEYAGSVSHGTLRLEDLFPRFLDLLKLVDPEAAGKIDDDVRVSLNAITGEYDNNPEYTPEEITRLREDVAPEVLADLQQMLDDAAPAGWYFGTIEGDGSDFGYWEAENDTPDTGPFLDCRVCGKPVDLNGPHSVDNGVVHDTCGR